MVKMFYNAFSFTITHFKIKDGIKIFFVRIRVVLFRGNFLRCSMEGPNCFYLDTLYAEIEF